MSLATYRKDIDGLRAVAALAVLAFHAGISVARGGYVGVDVFFVISGYLLSSTILKELHRGEFSFLRFYERRVRRIAPASVFMLAVSSVFACLLLTPTDLEDFGETLLSASTFGSNLVFWAKADYFDGSAQLKPLLHTWSLSIEEQFYIVFPIIVTVLHHLRPTRVRLGLVVCFVGSLVVCVIGTWRSPSAAFYLAPSRAFELLLGAALGASPAIELRRPALRELVASIGLVLIVACVGTFSEATRYPGAWPLLPCVGAACIILAGPGTRIGQILSTGPMAFIGQLSFSLYLLHWPMLVFARHWVAGPLAPPQIAVLLVLAFIAAAASRRWVEEPFLSIHGFRRRCAFLVAGLGMLGSLAFFLVLELSNGWPSRMNQLALRMDAARLDRNPDRTRCHASDAHPIPFEEKCTYGAAGADPTLVIWGDSYAAELAMALGDEARSHGRSLMLASYSGCPPVLSGLGDLCLKYNEELLTRLLNNPVQVVILVARYQSYVKTYGPVFFDGFDRVIKTLTNAGRTVVVTYPIPEPPANVPWMLARVAQTGGDAHGIFIDQRAYMSANQPTISFLDGVTQGPHVVGAHPEDRLCGGGRCEVYVGDQVLYFDEHHLSVEGARFIAPAFDRVFDVR